MDFQNLGQKVLHHTNSKKNPSLGNKFVVIVLVIAVVLVTTACTVSAFVSKDGGKVDESTYQVVVLTNGQSYFGRLSDLNDEFVTLTDVYYLQTQSGDPTDANKENQDQASQDKEADQNKLQLTRLGNEIHQPQRQMFIAVDNISYWENLKADGQVVKSIVQSKSNTSNSQQ